MGDNASSSIREPSAPGETHEATVETTNAFRSCPIKVEGLKNSLRTSIAHKRASMTCSELKFVEDMLEESLDEDELECMDSVLKCDQTFFQHESRNDNNADEEQEPQQPTDGEDTAVKQYSMRSSAPELGCDGLGSKKRQIYLEERRRQSEEASKRRSKVLWTKAMAATKMLNRLSTISKQKENEEQEKDVDEQDESQHDIETNEKETETETQRKHFFRRASTNIYGGEGFEIGVETLETLEEKKESTFDEEDEDDCEDEENDTFEADGGAKTFVALSSPTHRTEAFRRASVNIYGGDGFEVAEEDLFEKVYDGEERISYEDYDPWLFQEFDRTGKRRDFTILGTSHDDVDCHPHVLSPVQMDLFQPHLPDAKKGESFWLKYSLVRDGASTISFLKQVRASPYTLLAMETVDGEVFGGFFCSAWTIQPNYFGTGESFLWRMKDPRKLEGSLVEQNDRESDLEIFPSEIYYGNRYFQMCLQDKIVSGGGTASIAEDFGPERGGEYQPHQIGFGLQLGSGGSLLEGSSSASLTFRNPPLSRIHSDGSTFELVNLEAWGFTPCQTEEEARILEYKNMFFKRNASGSLSNSGRHASGSSL